MVTSKKETFKNKSRIEKDNLMFIIIFGLWIITMLHFDPKILSYLPKHSFFLAKLSVISFIICVNIFWLFGIYHLVIAFFSAFVAKRRKALNENQKVEGKVAILYLTMNDFREEAVLSCLNQDYSNFETYVLDDSYEREWKERVDKFVESHKQVKLIRRQSREYFKAGNLNNALNKIHKDYDYFAVSDSDGILPNDFLRKLLPYFSLNKRIGFVQANQRWNSKQDSEFAKDLGLNTDVHWTYYVPAKDKYGFVMFYGHGGIIRSDIWKEVGGFPHTITEDIAFSSILRERGYRGIFVPEVICLEDFPVDYKSFRTRNERWIKGTTEYLFKWFPRLLISEKTSWFEKVDIFISAGVLLQPFLFIIFLLIVSIVLPANAKLFGLHIPLIATFAPLDVVLATYFSGVYFYSSWTFDFFLIMAITAFAQFAPLIWKMLKNPIKVTRYMGSFLFICLASSIASFVNICALIITRKSKFLVTGIKKKKDTLEHKIIIFLELSFSAFLIFSSLRTGNIWLLTIPLSVLLNPFVYKVRWDNQILNAVTYFPFVLILLIILLVSVSAF